MVSSQHSLTLTWWVVSYLKLHEVLIGPVLVCLCLSSLDSITRLLQEKHISILPFKRVFLKGLSLLPLSERLQPLSFPRTPTLQKRRTILRSTIASSKSGLPQLPHRKKKCSLFKSVLVGLHQNVFDEIVLLTLVYPNMISEHHWTGILGTLEKYDFLSLSNLHCPRRFFVPWKSATQHSFIRFQFGFLAWLLDNLDFLNKPRKN